MDTISPLIGRSELAARLDDPSLILFDVTVELPSPRFDGDYRVESGWEGWKQGHIPGATHLDLLHDFSARDASFSFALPPLVELARRFQNVGIQDGLTPVLYDRTDGFWAARFWWMLRSVGKAARVLDGGYKGWLSDDYPVSRGRSGHRPSGHFTSVLKPGLWADRKRVLRILNAQEPGTLFCALARGLFDGTLPTRYARRGHIPGSRNLPARELLNANGSYRSDIGIREIWGPLLATSEMPLVLYCGGGISAASLALTLVLIGVDDIAIYDGSLQEWAADSDLPLCIGRTDPDGPVLSP